MKTLYIDNYKGFKDTFISLSDVNFLVGENSTGKTTILNLITLLSDSNFLTFLDFNVGDTVLGYFSELVNQNSEDKSYFSLGINFTSSGKKNGIKYIWLKFKDKENVATLSEYREVIDDKNVIVNMDDVNIKYASYLSNSENFEEWIREKIVIDEYKDLPKECKLLPFGVIYGVINSAVRNGEKNTNERIFTPPFFRKLRSFAPMRAKPERIYESFYHRFSSEGQHTSVILNKSLSSKQSNLSTWLRQFGINSNLFDDIEIKKIGSDRESPFSITILYNSVPINIANVGYGVSQVLPLLVEILISKRCAFSIQQPEVHLHPKAQAAFGDLLFESSLNNRNSFLIETHSDFIINRFRYDLSKSDKKVEAQILFFERDKVGLKVTPLKTDESGQFEDEVPDSYGNFFIDEELKMLNF